jgi:hypothetical protein
VNADLGGGLDVIASNVTLIYYTFVLKFHPSSLSIDAALTQHAALVLERWNFNCSATLTPRCALLLLFNFGSAKLPAWALLGYAASLLGESSCLALLPFRQSVLHPSGLVDEIFHDKP